MFSNDHDALHGCIHDLASSRAVKGMGCMELPVILSAQCMSFLQFQLPDAALLSCQPEPKMEQKVGMELVDAVLRSEMHASHGLAARLDRG
jgi:hypothetical protein